MWISPHHWTVDPVPVPGCRLVTARFAPGCLTRMHIEGSGIALPASIARSVPRRQAEFIAGRLCARDALLALTGHAQTPSISSDRAPQWPPGVCGSISHCSDIALAAVASLERTACIGVDIEHIFDERKADELHEQILLPCERERWFTLDSERRCRLLSLTFSIKESLYKALYPLTRRHFYFEDAELLEWSDSGQARLLLHIDLNDEFTSGRLLEGGFYEQDGYMLTWVSLPAARNRKQ